MVKNVRTALNLRPGDVAWPGSDFTRKTPSNPKHNHGGSTTGCKLRTPAIDGNDKMTWLM